MLNSSRTNDSSLDFEIRFTSRVLTHKLCTLPSFLGTGESNFPFCGRNSLEKFVPEFPLAELWQILNSVDNGSSSHRKVSKFCVDSNSGMCVTTEGRSCVGDEEEKRSVKDLSDIRPALPTTPELGNKKSDPSPNNQKALVPTSVQVEENELKAHKYEKKNIYYKAIFRDIRKYFIELLNTTTSYVQLKKQNNAFEPSIIHLINNLLGTENVSHEESEIQEMAGILGPFLNYNEYLICFEHKKKHDAHVIRDCLQNFTLTKMRKVLQYPIIKFVVKYYFKHTVNEGTSARLNRHKTMKKHPHKYLEVLKKILEIIETH